jgi:endonuclease/exonuclease/phosphatase family metal-dependent hydrolase
MKPMKSTCTKRISGILLLSLTLLARLFAPAAGAAETQASIRFVTWNIEWYPGKRQNPDPQQMRDHSALVRAELAKINPDVFLAQEMGDWQSFAELTDVIADLRPVVVSAFAHETEKTYWRQQIAIAAKLPVEAAWSEPWKVGVPTPRRGFSAAALKLPDTDKLLLVYSLHLKSNRASSPEETELNYRTRDESIRQLLQHINEMESTFFPDRVVGVVVGGDFNTNQDGQFGDNVVKMLLDAGFHHTWEGVPREERPTWRGNLQFQPTTFDHFFVKGLGKPRARMLQVADATSDHWPVELEITLP